MVQSRLEATSPRGSFQRRAHQHVRHLDAGVERLLDEADAFREREPPAFTAATEPQITHQRQQGSTHQCRSPSR